MAPFISKEMDSLRLRNGKDHCLLAPRPRFKKFTVQRGKSQSHIMEKTEH